MSDTQTLLTKIAALRQRLEQAQGLIGDVTTAAAALPESEPHGPTRLRLLVEQAAEGDLNSRLLDSALRQLPAPDGDGPDVVLPRQLTARASRLLRRGQDLLQQLRDLADQPLLERDSRGPLATRYRETVAMTEAVLRMVQAFPNAPSVQLRLCEGLEVILTLVTDRLAALRAVAGERCRQLGWVNTLAGLLTGLAEGSPPDVKPFVRLAELVLNEAEQAAPLNFFQADPKQPAHFAAAHSLNVAQVMARLVRHDPEWKPRTIDAMLAALVHDAGMAQVPATILAHSGRLNEEQRRVVEGHTLRGAELARRLLPNGPWLAEAAGAHHERLDGRGYPAGLRDAQIGPLTRLLAVCDQYAALCCGRPHRPAIDVRTALTDTLLLAEQGALDAEMAERLLQLAFYPVGTVVELADGSVGLVVATHQGRRDLSTPARPVLALLTDGQRQPLPVPRHLDLAECEGNSIVRSLPPEERRELLGKRFPELVEVRLPGRIVMVFSGNKDYFGATRHPWSALVFVLPLLAAYECGILWLASAQPETVRNGADTWLRWALTSFGLRQLYWAPVLLAVFLVGWAWARRRDRPTDVVGLWVGMTVESVIWGLGLWGVSCGMIPLLNRLGIQLQLPAPGTPVNPPEEAFESFINFLGAGIYEEVLFRLLLFTVLFWVLCYAKMSRPLALLLAGLGSAVLFSLAHHLKPFGEPFNNYLFLFRTIAGVYFTMIFQTRGFGICVGTHAFYDVLVGILIPYCSQA